MHIGSLAKLFLKRASTPAPTPEPAPQVKDEFKGRLKPSFILIGAQRCGTTSLYWYLSEHPQIIPAAQKEVHYFDFNFASGPQWYAAQFAKRGEEKPGKSENPDAWITGEASPYYLFHPLCAARVRAALPEARLLVMLRNPTDRALSHYQHETRLGNETLSFDEAIAREDERLQGLREKLVAEPLAHLQPYQSFSYRARGCYLDQIAEWLRHFPREQMHITISEDFYADPASELKKVTDFLGLPPCPAKETGEFTKYNYAEYSEMNPATRQWLVDFFRPHNQRLEEFLGRKLDWDR
ncbi:MAG: sulfotransferase [Chthoniobacteraceae bacterium]